MASATIPSQDAVPGEFTLVCLECNYEFVPSAGGAVTQGRVVATREQLPAALVEWIEAKIKNRLEKTDT